ncbi:MAG: hypothetical protein FWE44_00455 [Defluviitaleaceae bacterium]|nr:hypothetical protein [Defluviitaleaceae bacterium]
MDKLREKLQGWYNAVLEKWKGLTKSQKIKVTAIAATVLLALVLTLVFTLRTVWTPAFDVGDAAAAAAVQEVLADEGIRSQFDQATLQVSVPQADFARARLTAQRSPALSDPGIDWREVFDMAGMGITNTMQHHMIVQATETSIERALIGTGIINSATVTLVVPNTPVLIRSLSPSSASVIIGGAGRLTPEDGRAVALHVMRSVQGLTLDNITVTDTDFNLLFDGGEMVVGSGGAPVLAAIVAAERMQLERNVRNIFPMIDDLRVSAHVAVDISERINEAIRYSNPYEGGGQGGLIDSESHHTIVAVSSGEGFALEPGVITQGFPGSAPLLGEGLDEVVTVLFDDQGFRQHLHNRYIEHSTTPAGSIVAEDSGISIMAINDRIFDRADLVLREVIDDSESDWAVFQYENSANVRIEGDFTDYIAMAATATGIPAENISFMMYEMNHFIDFAPTTPLPLTQIILLALTVIFIALLTFGLIRRAQPQTIDDIEPELSVEDLLVSSQLEDAMEAEMTETERLAQIRHEQDSAVKSQIDKFATEKPESVAQLLRNWINEDWE